MATSPIALFTYNRPLHTRKTVEALSKNRLSTDSDLFVFSDGAKDDTAGLRVKEVRDYLKTISNFKSVHIIERSSNIGLADNIIAGVGQIIAEFGKVIVLEDDLLTSPYFLEYMNEGLNMYEKDDAVISIHGFVNPVEEKLPETFFLRGADCWGWATWKRGWDLFEPNGKKLMQELLTSGQTKEFDFDGSYPYLRMLEGQIEGKANSWAIRWYASAFLMNKFTLYPGKSLVSNIGGDGSGTNHGFDGKASSSPAQNPVKIFRIEIIQNIDAYRTFVNYYRKSSQRSLPNKIRRALKVILKSFQ